MDTKWGYWQYDLIKCVHWYIAYKDKLIDEARKGKETEGQARQRLVIAEANLTELQYARARGEVVEVEAVKHLWARLVLAFKSKILLMPSKLPTLVMGRDNPNEVREIIEKEVNEALNELSHARIHTSGIFRPGPFDETGGRVRKSSPKAHRKRVGGQRKGTKSPEQRRTGQVEDGPGRVSEGNDGRGDGSKGRDSDSHDSSEDRKDGSDQ